MLSERENAFLAEMSPAAAIDLKVVLSDNDYGSLLNLMPYIYRFLDIYFRQCVLLPPLPNLLLTFRQFIFNQFRDPCPGLSEKVVRSLPGSNLIFNLRLSTLGGKLNKQKGEDNCTSINP